MQEHIQPGKEETALDSAEADENQSSAPSYADEYDYNREPPLDSATISANRSRSKYVFMTLCFLVAVILLYTYLTNQYTGDWFPLVGAIVMGIMGVVFLRSSDKAPEAPPVNTGLQVIAPAHAEKLSPFEELVQEALANIPEEFHPQMDNVVVHVAYEPDEETLARVGVNEGHTLLGLYEGVPLTTYGRLNVPYPETITIYQRPIEEYCRHNPTSIREQVRSTVLHEVAHHFGMGHQEMPIWLQ